MNMRDRRFILPALALGLLAILPRFLGTYSIFVMDLIFIYILVSVGLNILSGYTGQISLGHAAFYAIGSYSGALLLMELNIPFLLSVLLAASFTGLTGFLLGLPCLRLSGLYLAMATLGFNFIVQEALLQLHPWTRGPEGLMVADATIGSFRLDTEMRWFYLLLIVTALMVAAAMNMLRGRTGRAFRAIRENEIAAGVMGVDLARYKTLAFTVSAFYTGMAGALHAYLVQFLDPQAFSLSQSIRFLTVIVLGGLGSVLGSILGAVFLTLLPEFLAGLEEWQSLVYGAVMVVCIIFMPTGLSGLIKRILPSAFVSSSKP